MRTTAVPSRSILTTMFLGNALKMLASQSTSTRQATLPHSTPREGSSKAPFCHGSERNGFILVKHRKKKPLKQGSCEPDPVESASVNKYAVLSTSEPAIEPDDDDDSFFTAQQPSSDGENANTFFAAAAGLIKPRNYVDISDESSVLSDIKCAVEDAITWASIARGKAPTASSRRISQANRDESHCEGDYFAGVPTLIKQLGSQPSQIEKEKETTGKSKKINSMKKKKTKGGLSKAKSTGHLQTKTTWKVKPSGRLYKNINVSKMSQKECEHRMKVFMQNIKRENIKKAKSAKNDRPGSQQSKGRLGRAPRKMPPLRPVSHATTNMP